LSFDVLAHTRNVAQVGGDGQPVRVPPWEWDETLYAGSAPYYPVGRMAYPPELADALAAELRLAGTGRLLDVGCGPGSLTLVLAPLFESVVGVDADRDMLEQARREAWRAGVRNASWRRMRAEELPDDLGRFRVITFAQSFHWMDQPRVAEAVKPMLEPGGAWVHVGATTDRGVPGGDPLPLPRPPWQQIADLVTGYLGPLRRAGQRVLASGTTRAGEDDVMRAAGYRGPVRIDVGGGTVAERTEDEVVAAVYSLSSSAPHLFGDRLADFDRDLRRSLRETAPSGRFAERRREVTLTMWMP
jgi:SAM-dependent methyltransferase